MALSVYFGVDWDKNGTYTDESAYLKANGLTIRRGRQTAMDGQGFTSLDPAEVWGELSNVTNRYDPFNAASPIYGYILPGRPCKVTVTSGVTTKTVFAGWLTDIRTMGEKRKNAIFRGSDGIIYLDKQYATAISQYTESVAGAMQVLLDQSGWPAAPASYIEDNGETFAFSPEPSETLYQEMSKLRQAFCGDVFISSTGVFKFYTRGHQGSTVLEITEDEILREFETRSPWDEIYNEIRVNGYLMTEAIAVNSTSIADYGRRTSNVGDSNNDYIQGQQEDIAAYALDYGHRIKHPLRIKLINRFDQQFGVDLLDRVSVAINGYTIDNLYTVGYIEHRFLSNDNCETTIFLEPYYYEIIDNLYPLTFPFSLGW